MKIVYIAHPIAGDIENNLAKIRGIVKKINATGCSLLPFVPYYTDVVSLDDNDPIDRARGMLNNREFFVREIIDEVWLFGDHVSLGMATEIALAHKFGIPVKSMSESIKL